MISIDRSTTIYEALNRAVHAYPDNCFLATPSILTHLPNSLQLTYRQVLHQVEELKIRYEEAGFGMGHRIGVFLENRLDALLHKLAINSLGACCVPINPDYGPHELAYVIDHANVDLFLVLDTRLQQLMNGIHEAKAQPPVITLERFCSHLPSPYRQAKTTTPSSETIASILYTSGTTGRPKGCLLSHRYELAAGAWYATRGGEMKIRTGQERLYNPLPLFHVNASVLSFYCMMLTGGCYIQAERFQPTRWWGDIRQSKATIVHYLGVIVAMLMNQPIDSQETNHCVRFGAGAGVEPTLHAAFEKRFGIPLVELWGMTEIVRILTDNESPRQVGTRAIGRSQLGLEVRVVDSVGNDVPDGSAGEMLLRSSEEDPRQDFFSGYLDDEEATAEAWRGGWFHTGDIVKRAADGMIYFLDRQKNIIRRSGENIAAAEIEAYLQVHPLVHQVAVVAVPDEVREEEVFACIVLNRSTVIDGVAGSITEFDAARILFEYCMAGLAYFKAPGWIWCPETIPVTATQKVQKHQIFSQGIDPRTMEGVFDMRLFKNRKKVKDQKAADVPLASTT